MLPTLLLLVQLAAVAATATRLSGPLAGPGAPSSDRALVGLVVALAEVVLVGQLLGAAHVLSPGPMTAALVVVAVAALRWVPRSAPAPPPGPSTVPGILTAVLAVLVGALDLVLGLDGTSREADTVEYHLPNALLWMRSHSLWDLPYRTAGYFENAGPSNLELSAVWLMAPFGDDRLAYTTNIAWGALLVLGIAVAARELGAPLWTGALGAVALVLAPTIAWTEVHSLMSDVAAAAGISAGLALVLVQRNRPGGRWWFVAPGLAIGLGIGSKYTALLPGIGVIVLAALLSAGALGWRAAARRSAALAGVALVPSVFWLIRNTRLFHNPLYPQTVHVLGVKVLNGSDSPLTVYDTPIATHLAERNGAILDSAQTIARQLVGPMLVVLAVGIVAGLVVGFRREQPRALFLVAGLAGAAFVAYLFTPYTGGGPGGEAFLIATSLRYGIPALALATVCCAAALPARVAAVLFAWPITYGIVQVLRGPSFRPDVDVTSTHALAALFLTFGVLSAWATVLEARQPRETS